MAKLKVIISVEGKETECKVMSGNKPQKFNEISRAEQVSICEAVAKYRQTFSMSLKAESKQAEEVKEEKKNEEAE